LAAGPVRVQNGSEEEAFFCSGGFLEVQPDLVTVLSDTAERAESLDESEAIKAKEAAEQELANKDASLDYAKASCSASRSCSEIKNYSKITQKPVRYIFNLI
jgi:F-type H+-transporting ATPase subunit epsilon